MNATKSFVDLSAQDQRTRLIKRQDIEANWGCDIMSCIPAKIRPKQMVNTRVKSKVGEEAPDAPWWRWSDRFIGALERVSSLTKDKLRFAQELMLLEVQQRHQDIRHRQRDTGELVKSDLERIVEDLKRQYTIKLEDDDDDNNSDNEDRDLDHPDATVEQEDAEDVDDDDADLVDRGDGTLTETPRKRVNDNTLTATMPSAKRTKKDLETAAKVASLRAKAMRLRQQASGLEAEACEMESKNMRAIAKDVA